MDGIEGLKLISVAPNILSNTQIIFIKFIIIFLSITSILSLFLVIKNNKESKARFIPPIILIITTAILALIIFYGLENYNKELANCNVDTVYTFEIVNEDYNIDLDKYEIIEMTDTTITVIQEKTKGWFLCFFSRYKFRFQL